MFEIFSHWTLFSHLFFESEMKILLKDGSLQINYILYKHSTLCPVYYVYIENKCIGKYIH